jgi:hypothetical protein
MGAFFEWLQNLPFSVWIAESDSLWGFPFVLFMHSLGMGLTGGVFFVLDMRLIGIGAPLPVSSLRFLFRIFWVGLLMNFITGSILFAAAATGTGYVWIYYAKLALLVLATLLALPLQAFVQGGTSDGAIPGRIRGLAAVSLMTWLGIITCGRLIAYVRG